MTLIPLLPMMTMMEMLVLSNPRCLWMEEPSPFLSPDRHPGMLTVSLECSHLADHQVYQQEV